jgi:hypothetical protein
MQKPVFHFRISGAGLLPETMPVGDLADVLKDMEAAIIETAGSPEQAPATGLTVSLVSISEGSIELGMAVEQATLPAVTRLSQAIASESYEDVPRPAHEKLQSLSSKLADREWALEFLAERGLDISPAMISGDHQVPAPPPPRQARGTTTICGRCVRVGGATKPRAMIQLEGADSLHIDVTEELAKELARNLYEVVALEGEAVWRTEDWQLEAFSATRVTDYKRVDARLAFDRLASAAGTAWDQVDAEEYVRNVRGGGPQP